MKLRRRLNYHSLKRGRVRQTWNKYNLYNLARVERTLPNYVRRTFFQQKWTAKALTRAYHGEHITEGKWENMFRRRLLSVVNMDPKYMAYNDGSEQAAGRGSGLDQPRLEDVTPWRERGQERSLHLRGGVRVKNEETGKWEPIKPLVDTEEIEITPRAGADSGERNTQPYEGSTPYMNMTFAPQERRIDIAIFRALFASSVRQARQFVVHGRVTVNGQKMNHPSYLLNPGDMFQVDPECVMLATGRKKTKPHPEPAPGQGSKKSAKAAPAEGEAEEEAEAEAEEDDAVAESAEAESAEADEAKAQQLDPDLDKEQITRQLKFLSKLAQSTLKLEKKDLSGKAKQRMRLFVKEARSFTSRLNRRDGDEAMTTDLVGMINDMLKEMVIKDPKVAEDAAVSGGFTAEQTADATAAAEDAAAAKAEKEGGKEAAEKKEEGEEETDKAALKTKSAKTAKAPEPESYEMSDEEVNRLAQLVREEEENPHDDSKPYATPWQPRRFMSPFAFIPRYLEVNQNICAAVYLRHPVARQGLAEVPTPFPPKLMQLVYNWYLRRR